MSSNEAGPNDAGYEQRLQFVRDLLTNELKLVPDHLETIAYEIGFPFPYNNFMFLVETSTKITAANQQGRQPGTVHIRERAGPQKFILRLPNSASGYNDSNRVENEVAAMSLARSALQTRLPNLVADVFAWGAAANGKQGWMLQEYMPGQPLGQDFPGLNSDSQQSILEQMADILDCFQQYEIPSSIKGYGGLTFNMDGQVVIGALSTRKDGPFEQYEELRINALRSELAKADSIPRISGWRANGIRARLDKFLENGPARLLSNLPRRQSIIHADFTTDNLLYDPATARLTAVVDFDFSYIGTVADEYFHSLEPDSGRLHNARDEETRSLTEAMFMGFPTPLPPTTEVINWSVAKAWDDALRKRQMSRPGNIPGIKEMSEIVWLASQILPWKLESDVVAKNNSPDAIQKWKKDGEEALDKFLKDQGF